MSEKLTYKFGRKFRSGAVLASILVAACGGEAILHLPNDIKKKSTATGENAAKNQLTTYKVACWAVEGWQFGVQPQQSNATLRKVAKQMGVKESDVRQGNEDILLCQSHLTEAQVQERAPVVAVENFPIPHMRCIAENALPELDVQEGIPKAYEPMDAYCVFPTQGAGQNTLAS